MAMVQQYKLRILKKYVLTVYPHLMLAAMCNSPMTNNKWCAHSPQGIEFGLGESEKCAGLFRLGECAGLERTITVLNLLTTAERQMACLSIMTFNVPLGRKAFHSYSLVKPSRNASIPGNPTHR